jgi:hypothetical protein
MIPRYFPNPERLAREDLDALQKEVGRGWFYFGRKGFICPGITDERIAEYLEEQRLPDYCRDCYKGLVLWDGNFAEGAEKLFSYLASSERRVYGKTNGEIAVFYFRRRADLQEFLAELEAEADLPGKLDWRRACKKYQEISPDMWKSEKEFAPPKKRQLKPPQKG